MADNNKQHEILAMFQGDRAKIITGKEIKAKFKGQYLFNGEKHVQERIQRLVNNGMLERVEPGKFRLGQRRQKQKPLDDNENQTTLF